MRYTTVLVIIGCLVSFHAAAQGSASGGKGAMGQYMQQRMQELDALVVQIGNENDAQKRQVMVREFRRTMQENVAAARRIMHDRMQNRAARHGFAQQQGPYPASPYYGQSWMPRPHGYGRAMHDPSVGHRCAPAQQGRAGKGKHHLQMEAQLDRIEAMLKQLLGQSGADG